jgi:hypothetical protein
MGYVSIQMVQYIINQTKRGPAYIKKSMGPLKLCVECLRCTFILFDLCTTPQISLASMKFGTFHRLERNSMSPYRLDFSSTMISRCHQMFRICWCASVNYFQSYPRFDAIMSCNIWSSSFAVRAVALNHCSTAAIYPRHDLRSSITLQCSILWAYLLVQSTTSDCMHDAYAINVRIMSKFCMSCSALYPRGWLMSACLRTKCISIRW